MRTRWRGIAWRRIPWPLWVYAVATLVAVMWIEIDTHGPVLGKVLFPIVMGAWLCCLFKGVRWVWIATIGISVLGFVPDAITGSLTVRGVSGSLIGLVLLMLPVTRRHFSARTAPASS